MEGLVGDIGGTHARFALAKAGEARIHDPYIFSNRDFPSIEAVIDAYLRETKPARPPKDAVLAVAGPVTNGAIRFTNLDWEISEDRLRREAGFGRARLINDFAAQALGAPRTSPNALRRIGPDTPGAPHGTLAVMGPGTGFGVAGLVRGPHGDVVIPTEGGHAGFAPSDETELEIWRWFEHQRPHVSIERILSGPGLYQLYRALAEIGGVAATLADQRQVQDAALKGDPLAAAAIDRICLILGSTAGDFALSLGARGGVYITGGVGQGLADNLAAGGFRQRFEAKGRFEAYMQAIPTWTILEPYTALIGAATVLGSLEAA